MGSLEQTAARLPDEREGPNQKYHLLDAVKSVFAVFFFLHPLLPAFQRAMQEKRKRNNVETLFGVMNIPSDNQIRTLLDGIEPAVLGGVFQENLRTAQESGVIDHYRVLDGGVLIAIDGLWRHPSTEIYCERCLYQQRGRTYYHGAVALSL